MSKLEFIKSENFGGAKCNFYKAENDDIVMSRFQIGKALKYSDPIVAIGKIHDRHKSRLDRFSTITKVVKVEGDREVTRNIVVYSYKGIYEICRWSQQPKADEFMDWVWNVIEDIRKHGMYAVDELIQNPDLAIKAFTALKQERDKNKSLQIANQQKDQLLAQQKPKVLFADAVETSSNSILIGELAKILKQNGINIGQNRLFRVLRKEGYLIKQKGENYNLPTQYSMDLGLLEIKKRVINNPDGTTRTTKTPKVTGKGQIYFVNKFKSGELAA